MIIIGIDVSKNTLDCALMRDDFAPKKAPVATFANNATGVKRLLAWAKKRTGEAPESMTAVLEATGIYHETAAYALDDSGVTVVVLNPARARDYARSQGRVNKTDRVDSQVLAQFGLTQPLPAWQPESAEIRLLRALAARLEALKKDLQRELNRLEKAEVAGDSTEVVESIGLMRSQLESEIRRVEKLIDDHFDQHPGLRTDRALLETIPGIGPVVARMLCLLMHRRQFASARALAAFLGLVPSQRESGTSLRGQSRLSKNGQGAARATLYMAAVVAKQYNPDAKALYERLIRKGKAKKSALCAVMRKLVQICFGVIKHQSPYRVQTV